MNQDINENSVIADSSPVHKPPEPAAAVTDISTKSPTMPGKGPTGGGDDSGTFSEVIEQPNLGPQHGNDDPVNEIVPQDTQENSSPTPCCEQQKPNSCDRKQSDNYECSNSSSFSSRTPSNNADSDSYLNSLVSNFNKLYEGKLQELEKKTGNEMELLQQKNALFRDWIRDLHEQNALLIETVEEMEKETEQKIETLQRKMQKSTKLTESHMLMISEYEKQVQEFLSQRMKDENEKSSAELRLRVGRTEARHKKLEAKLGETEKEVENLVTLVTRVRDLGVWDINGLQFEPRTYYRLFELYPNLPGSEVQTVFTKEKAKKARDAQKQMEQMSTKFEDLLKYKAQFEEILTEKEKNIKTLENQNEQLKTRAERLEQQSVHSKTSLDEVKTKLMEANMRRDINIERLQAQERELKELRLQLSKTSIEKENAVKEASLLKSEMRQRMEEMNHMKNLLRTIQTETDLSKNQVTNQISALKEELQLYQTKYEDAKKSLRNKSEEINNLQSEVEQLQQKVSKLELSSHSSRFLRRSQSHCSKNSVSASDLPEASGRKPPWNEHFVKCDKDCNGKDPYSINLSKDYAEKLFTNQEADSKTWKPPTSDFMKHHQKINEQILSARRQSRQKRTEKPETVRKDSEKSVQPVFSEAMLDNLLRKRFAKYFPDDLDRIEEDEEEVDEPMPAAVIQSAQNDQGNRPPTTRARTAINYKDHQKKKQAEDFRKRTLDALVTAAVEASQQMMDKFNANRNIKMKVTATRSHHRQQSEELEARRVTHSRGGGERGLQAAHTNQINKQDKDSFTHTKCVRFESSHRIKGGRGRGSPTLSARRSKAHRRTPHYNGDPESILDSLPKESQEYIVRSWIAQNPQVSKEIAQHKKSRKLESRSKPINPSRSYCNHHNSSKVDKLRKNKSFESNPHAFQYLDNLQKSENATATTQRWTPNKEITDSDTDSELRMGINEKSNGNGNHYQADINTNGPTLAQNGDWVTPQAYKELQNRVTVLESQILSKDTLISSLHCEVEVEKLSKSGMLSSMDSKDVEITMQKLTIKHLQDALVSLKKSSGISQPPPAPPQQPSVPSANGKVFDI